MLMRDSQHTSMQENKILSYKVKNERKMVGGCIFSQIHYLSLPEKSRQIFIKKVLSVVSLLERAVML